MKPAKIKYLEDKTKSGFLSPFLAKRRALEAVALTNLNSSVLDYGCNHGHLAQFYKPSNYFGYDIDDEAINAAKKAFPQYTFSNHTTNLTTKFDYIISLAVIEHVSDPKVFLKKLIPFLKNRDSKIILTTPNPKMEFIHKILSKFGIVSSHADEDHEKLLSFEDIANIANDLNLKVIKKRYFLFFCNQIFLISKEN